MTSDRPPIATDDEVRELLTRIMRGEQMTQPGRPATITERLKAADLLGRSMAMWGGRFREWERPPEFMGDEELED